MHQYIDAFNSLDVVGVFFRCCVGDVGERSVVVSHNKSVAAAGMFQWEGFDF